MECPGCHAALVRKQTPHGMVFVCPKCSGRMVGLPVLRKFGASRGFLNRIWRQGRDKSAKRKRPCAHCGRKMSQVHALLERDSAPLWLDVCPTCAAIWFDPSEFEKLPRLAPRPEKKEEPMHPKAREALAMHKLQMIREQQEQEEGRWGHGPDEGWQWLPGLLGMPVEIDAPKVSRKPILTWSIVGACVLLMILIMSATEADPIRMKSIFDDYGFIPSQWLRLGGLTLFSSFFLHAGIMHIIGNMYFLMIFGDNVEDHIGRGFFPLLLLVGHGAGMMAHSIFAGDLSVPCVGASAGISAVIGYYAVAFPKVKLGFMWRYWFYFRWVRISAVWALVLYSALQLFGAYSQVQGFSGVSYLAHIGGLAVGITAAFLYRGYAKQRTRTVLNYK